VLLDHYLLSVVTYASIAFPGLTFPTLWVG